MQKAKIQIFISSSFANLILELFMCLGSGIYIFLASKRVSLVVELKRNKELT